MNDDIKNIKKNIKNFYPSASEGLVDLCLKAIYENPNKIDSVTKFVWYCNNLLKEERGYIHTGQSGSIKSTRLALVYAGVVKRVGRFDSLNDKGKSYTWRQKKESEKRKNEKDFKKKNDIYNAEWKYRKQKDIDYRKSVKAKIKREEYDAEWKRIKQKDIPSEPVVGLFNDIKILVERAEQILKDKSLRIQEQDKRIQELIKTQLLLQKLEEDESYIFTEIKNKLEIYRITI